MISKTSTAALTAALYVGLTGSVVPVASAAPANPISSIFQQNQDPEQNADPVVEDAVLPFGGDKSQGCTLEWESASTWSGTELEHHSKVYSPYEGEDRTSAGALEVHAWPGQVRVPVTAAFPIEEGAILTVTLPEGASEDTIEFKDSMDNWITSYYKDSPYVKAAGADYFGAPTWDGNVVTFTSTQRIPKNAAFDLRFIAAGEQLQGETQVRFEGSWDPLQVSLARDERNKHAVPDCFRPNTEVRDGNRTDRCDVDWIADAVMDRRFDDWVNQGFVHKVKSQHQTEAPAEANAPGSMEVQHYSYGDTLYVRIPVGTDRDMSDARLVIELPEIDGYEWTVAPTIAPFYPVGEYDAVAPLPAGQLVSDDTGTRVVYEIGDFPAGTAFTAVVTMDIPMAEFDRLTAPVDGQWSDLFHPAARLTGEYAEGTEDCGVEPVPGESSVPGGSAIFGLGLSALAGSALLSSGGDISSAIPDGSATPEVPGSQAPGSQAPGEGPATEVTEGTAPGTPSEGAAEKPATGPVSSPDVKAQAQMQALNAPAAPAKQATQPAPAAQQAAPVAQAQGGQLADTGVAGTLKALAMGMLAVVVGGALLTLRRRA
ncbi:MAG: hypothetical protein Q4G50_12485 [Corynebacterium sp.]|uniref:hypothetical protein n=1 Tax=Corynebacterium sp. TaxID=1720 RepID=UPI0026E071CC|nr:hypothetical protein [Corynebacterium sp.]MDO5670803.1 hypothetical protein [Corynebacterium sp.]